MEIVQTTIDEKQRMKHERILKEQMDNFLQAVIKEVSYDPNDLSNYMVGNFVKRS